MAAEKGLSTNNAVKGSCEAFKYDKHKQGMENQGSIKTATETELAVDHGLHESCISIGRYLYYLLFLKSGEVLFACLFMLLSLLSVFSQRDL